MPKRKKRVTTLDLLEAIERGEDRAVSQAISILHDNRPQRRALKPLLAQTPRFSHRIGITGPAAGGKSTLIGALSRQWGNDGKCTGILAIDPTDHATGGAQLGDRTRMTDNYLEPWFFLRSLATRNDTRGLVKRLDELLLVFDAAKKDFAVVETIGAAQDAVAIRQYVDTLVLVLIPTGDAVTYGKAGLTDRADIFVVNYSDFPGAQRSADELRSHINLFRKKDSWKPPVLLTNAHQRQGIDGLAEAIEKHRIHLSTNA